MEKINCDIIQDLIPSYLDGICSEATRRCVEEHTRTCEKCRQTITDCRNNTLSGKKLDEKALDGLKKVRNMMRFQKFVSLFTLLLMIFLGVRLYVIRKNIFSYSVCLIIFVLSMFINILSGMLDTRKRSPEKAELLSGAAAFALDIYLAVIILYSIKRFADGSPLFGWAPEQYGPFLMSQSILSFVIQLALFLYHFICIVQQDKNCSWLLCLDMTGIFLALEYAQLFGSMDTFDGFLSTFIRITFATAVTGTLGIAASFLLIKDVKKTNTSF